VRMSALKRPELNRNAMSLCAKDPSECEARGYGLNESP
jgi:hypothetical protein